MSTIVFRDLPGVAAVERQLSLHARDRLFDDEIEDLPHLLDDTSIALFGIARHHTFYGALPAPVRVKFSRAQWDAHFALLGEHRRDPNHHWRAFDLDLRCPAGDSLHCLEPFGRQLICALSGLHPQAVLAFADARTAQAA